MCFCQKPTRNDSRMGYKLELYAPSVTDEEKIIFDECGRCQPQVNGTGDIDYHAYHYRLVSDGFFYLLKVRHGGGEESFRLGTHSSRLAEILTPLTSDERYLLLNALHSAHRKGTDDARIREAAEWRQAAAEKRIKTRKTKRGIKVWIADKFLNPVP